MIYTWMMVNLCKFTKIDRIPTVSKLNPLNVLLTSTSS